MNLFGAMNTAISGLNAQSAAFNNISDNVANSQTVGFKRVDTAFVDYLTSSTASNNIGGAAVARPEYQNNIQGTVAQTDNPLGLAISGQGFFAVSHPTGNALGNTQFSPTLYYSRAGDFQLNKNGYLVNSSGDYLNGWSMNAQGAVNQNTMSPIQVTETVFNPIATGTIQISANLPATPTPGAPISSQLNIYDGVGTPHAVTLNWTQTATNTWAVSINSPDDVAAAARGTANVGFGPAFNGVASGTIGSISTTSPGVTASTFTAGAPATFTFNSNFGQGTQPITINLGTYGGSTGVTQYAGTAYSPRGLTQDGVPPGSFSSISTNTAGEIIVNYDNGQERPIARVPIVTFASPNALQRQNGQAFTATVASGNPLIQSAGTNGAGAIVTGSIEQSNVDIGQEFSKLIVAQRAYTANTKLVTTADELLRETLDMKR